MAQDLYTSQGKPAMLGGESVDKFKSKRGASALEGFHGIQKDWLGQRMHSRKRGLALVADGTVRHNRGRRNQQASNLQQTPPVYAAGLLLKTSRRHRGFIEDGVRRLLSHSVAHVRSPVRHTDDNKFYDLQSLVTTNAICNDVRMGNEEEIAAKEAGHEQPDGVTAKLRGPENPVDLPVLPVDENDAANKGNIETETTTAQVHKQLRQRKTTVDSSEKCSRDRSRAPSEQQLSVATSGRKGCRTCRMIGTACRLYKRIQWCESADLPFDDWIKSTFPTRKAAALKRTQRDATGRGKPKGRPRKPNNL